jgi:hypothetical protein
MNNMSTNYYAVKGEWQSGEEFETIKQHFSGRPAMIHIGKSSAGWCFSLHVYPEMHVRTLDDWKSLADKLIATGWRIEDEYREVIPLENLWRVVERADYKAGAELLRRHKPAENYCIGNGPGHYDYIIGDFS